jgi:hypothetical protein
MRLILLSILVLLSACATQKLSVVKQGNKFGVINKRGRFVVAPKWDWLMYSHENKQLLVCQDSLYGFVDKKGGYLIKPRYKDAQMFSEGLAAVSNGRKFSFINAKGDTIIPFEYDDIFWDF